MPDNRITIFGVQTFVAKGARLIAEVPRSAKTSEEALRLARNLASRKAGVIAFSACGEPEIDCFDDPIILAEHGRVPVTREF